MKNVSTEQHIKYKIKLYKLFIPSDYERADDINLFLTRNVEDIDYNFMVWNFEEREYFTDVIKGLYTIINSFSDKDDLKKIIQTYDLTNFVNTTNANYFLNNINTLSLRVSDVSSLETQFPELEFYEDDLIQIHIYDSNKAYETKFQEVKTANSSLTDQQIESILYRPYFTGFITSISQRKARGDVEEITLGCNSLMKLFTINAIIFNLAIAESFSAVMEGMDILDPKMLTVWQNRFADKSAKDIIIQLMDELFISREYGTTKAFFIDFDRIKEKYITPTLEQDKFIFHPLLRYLLLLVYIKGLKLSPSTNDPILVFDDDFEKSSSNYPIDLGSELFPYLLQTKSAFSVYESGYEMPMQLIDRIRGETFLEFFEDKSGVFHFRAPQYNDKLNVYSIPEERIINQDYNKTDSTVYSAVGMRNLMPLVGTLELPNRIFFNRFLVSKYGLRIPKIFENPNVLSPHLGDLFARFYSDFFNSKSRRASISLAGVSGLQVGQMAFFSFRNSNRGYAGYISEIREDISIGNSYVQTLTLTFVREAFKAATKNEFQLIAPFTLVDYLTESVNLDEKLVLLAPYFKTVGDEQAARTVISKRLELQKSDLVSLKWTGKSICSFRPVMSLFHIARSMTLDDLRLSTATTSYTSKTDKELTTTSVDIETLQKHLALYKQLKQQSETKKRKLESFNNQLLSILAKFAQTGDPAYLEEGKGKLRSLV